MKLRSIIRWEFSRAVRSKQFLLISVLIPVMIAVAIFAASSAGREAQQPLTGPMPAAAVAMILAMILFMGAFLNGVMALYGVVKDKQSRVAELLLSSVSAREMMGGKILGLGIAGLLQVTVWATLAYFVAGQFTPISLAALGIVHWVTYPILFVLGYLFIASLYAAVGAMMKDVQSGGASGVVGLIPYLPVMFAAFIFTHPNHILVRIAGYIPPLTPATLMLRIGVTEVPAWEIGLCILSLTVGVAYTMRLAARVYEIGLLVYGKTVTPRELWRWMRHQRRV